jgi:hypothetical protein
MECAGIEVIQALRVSQILKEQAVRRQGVGTDVPMMLHLLKGGVSLGMATLIGERQETISKIVAIAGLSDADQIVHVSDAYATYKIDAVPDHGDLARGFADGNLDILECLNAVSVRIDGATAAVQSPYTYGGRTVIWGEPIDIANEIVDELGGDYPDAVRMGFEGQKVRPIPALNPAEISRYLGCPFVMPVMGRPPRNGPCPCDSGRKAKLCCWT